MQPTDRLRGFWFAPGSGATDKQIGDTELLIGRALPAELRALLRARNGGVSICTAFVEGVRYFPLLPFLAADPGSAAGSFTSAHLVRRDFDVPDDVIVFAAQGNSWLGLCYAASSGEPKVVYRDGGGCAPEIVAPSFREFLDHLIEE